MPRFMILDRRCFTVCNESGQKKVIVKERPFSALFRTGLFTEIHGKRGQTTAYGVIKL